MAERQQWGSRIGFLLAAIGSAVGLGNIWRFSYMAYENGGGAFLIPYIIAFLLAGVPLMILEYALGHREKASPPLAFARIKPLWESLGWWMPVVTFFGINLFYTVIVGWCMNYFVFSFDLSWGSQTEQFFQEEFLQISSSPFDIGNIVLPILVGTAFTWLLCWIICFRKISSGIEKASMIFMPILFLLTLVLVAWSVQLEGAWEAIKKHYLSFDFSKIDIGTASGRKVWVDAFGQIFFSLGLGFGVIATYSSYLPRKTNIISGALTICSVNCLYSFIAGFAVFGTIGYMSSVNGIPFEEAIKGGTGLAFVVYPEAINQLPAFNKLFGAVFFLILIVAGLSSAISLTETLTCSISDKFNVNRGRITTLFCVIGFLGSLIFTTQGGIMILDIVDHFIGNYALIIGGIAECLLVGWILTSIKMRRHIDEVGTQKLWPIWDIAIRYITPSILFIILGVGLFNEIKAPYEGYEMRALIIIGVGALLLTYTIAFILSRFSWKNYSRSVNDQQ
jgi:NSS family neurotransmitter:Na+ symporter